MVWTLRESSLFWRAIADLMISADNYAWMSVFRWFAKTWNWNPGPGEPNHSVLTFTDDPYYGAWSMPDNDPLSVSDIPQTITCPLTCTDNGTTFDCSLVAESYDNWLLESGYPCVCTEVECTDSSPSYCGNSSCPVHDWSTAGCTDDSPACCDSGACQWAT